MPVVSTWIVNKARYLVSAGSRMFSNLVEEPSYRQLLLLDKLIIVIFMPSS